MSEATGNYHKLDSVAQSRSLGQPVQIAQASETTGKMSLDEMARRAEELSKSLDPQPAPEVLKEAPKKKKQGVWGLGSQRRQLEAL